MVRVFVSVGIIIILVGGLLIGLGISSENIKSIKGELINIDATNSLLVIKRMVEKKAEEIIIYIAPDTVVRSGKSIKLGYDKDALSDLKVGDSISVLYLTDAQGKKIGHSILKSPPTKTKSK